MGGLAAAGRDKLISAWREAAGVGRGDIMLLLSEVVKVLLFYYYGGEFEVPLSVVGTVRGRE